MDNMAAALMFRYRPLSSMFRIWRKKEEPAYVEDGVEYYLSRATKRAIRQADRMMKRMSKLHRARPYNRPENGHVHVVMETIRFSQRIGISMNRTLVLFTNQYVLKDQKGTDWMQRCE